MREILKRGGVASSVAYALLMAYAYGSQITKLFKVKDPTGLSLNFFIFALLAVLLRINTIVFAIKEIWDKGKIVSINIIALAIAQIIVIVGLATVIIQILIYQ